MACRYRCVSQPAFSFIKSTISKPATTPVRPLQLRGGFLNLGYLQSLIPLHSAVSSARLNSCLGIDRSRSLTQEMDLSTPR